MALQILMVLQKMGYSKTGMSSKSKGRNNKMKITIKVTTHSGDEDILTVDEFDPVEINDQLNDNELQSILIGDHIYSRIDVKNIKPISEPEEPEEDSEEEK